MLGFGRNKNNSFAAKGAVSKMTIFKVHFKEQTIEINGDDYDGHCNTPKDAEFIAISQIEADGVEVEL